MFGKSASLSTIFHFDSHLKAVAVAGKLESSIDCRERLKCRSTLIDVDEVSFFSLSFKTKTPSMSRQVPSTRKMVGRDGDIGKSSIKSRIWEHRLLQDCAGKYKHKYQFKYKYSHECKLQLQVHYHPNRSPLPGSCIWPAESLFSPTAPSTPRWSRRLCRLAWELFPWFVFGICCFARHLVRLNITKLEYNHYHDNW